MHRTPTPHPTDGRPRARSRGTRLALGAGLAAALTIGSASTAFAAAPPAAGASGATSGNAKAACLAAIDHRLSTLGELTTAAAKDRDPANAGALQAELAAETTGLTGLRTQVDAAGDAATLRTLCPKVVYDYRVFALEVPTTHLAVAADGELAVAAQLDAHAPDLQELIDAAKRAGTDTGREEAELADLRAKTAAAHQAVTGTGATVIGLTPAQFNSGEATPVLQSARTAVEQTRADLTVAVHDAKDIVAALRPGH